MKKMRGLFLILVAFAILCLILAAGAEAKAIVIYGNTATYVYDGQMHEVTGFSASSSGGFSYIGNAAARGTEVGTYAMGLKADDFLVDPGETIDVIDGWMMITRRPITVNITGHSAVVDYDGQEHTVSGYDVEIEDELYTENDFSFHGDASVSGTAVNSYSMWLDESDFENENNNFDVTFVVTDGRLTIQENQIEIIDEGTCGDNLTWTLDDEGVLTISGTGEMTTSPWNTSDVKTVVIDEGVTSIKDYAFYFCSNLTSVTIPDSMISIGTDAFYFCSNLTSVTIPEGVTGIGDYAFYFCGLTSIAIPDSVTRIGANAFQYCTNLTSVTIGDGLTSISGGTFHECSSLANITLPDSLTSIGHNAFEGCRSLTGITIPDGVTSIDEGAFMYCESLASITIPDSLNSIGNWAFYGCNRLKAITVESLESWLTINYADASSHPNYASDCHLYLGNEEMTNITIPNSVTGIPEYAFNNCGSLTGITIPDSVTGIGNYAFNNCSNLTDITIPESVTGIGNYAFHGCGSLTGITIPESVTGIGQYAFENCNSLTCVTIPESVTSIGSYAFAWCRNLAKAAFLHPDDETLTVSFADDIFSNSPTIYCYIFSPVDVWASGKYTVQYLDEVLDDIRTVGLPEDFRMPVGESRTIPADVFPADGSEITWVSSNPDIVSLENGVVTAVGAGTATVTATVGTASDSVDITVFVPATGFEFSEPEYWLEAKDSIRLQPVHIQPEGASASFTWSSSNENYATVDAEGNVTTIRPGDVTITATTENGVSNSCLLHLTYPVTEVNLYGDEVHLNDSIPIYGYAVTRNAEYENKLLSFSSSDESIVTVDEHGMITGISTGTATITARARYSSSVSATAEVVVLDHEGVFEYTDRIEPTCEEEGWGVEKTCTVCFRYYGGEYYPPLGHDWSETEYTWDEHHTHVTATRICSHDPSHIETETVRGFRQMTAIPYETEEGAYRLVSESFTNPDFEQQDLGEFPIPALNDMNILRIPYDVHIIDEEAFAGSNAQALILQSSNISIGSRAFADMDRLLYVYTFLSPSQIPADAFEGSDFVVFDFRD